MFDFFFDENFFGLRLPSKPLTLILMGILFVGFMVKITKIRSFFVSSLLSISLVASSLLNYEIVWNTLYLLSTQSWKSQFIMTELFMFIGGEFVLFLALFYFYGIKYDTRMFLLISGVFTVGCVGLSLIGFYPLWLGFDTGTSNYNPHLFFPYNLIWLVSKIPVVGWLKVVRVK